MPVIDRDAYGAALLRALEPRGTVVDTISLREETATDGRVELHTVVEAHGTASYAVCFLTADEAADLDAVAAAVTARMEWQGQPGPALEGGEGSDAVAWGDPAL